MRGRNRDVLESVVKSDLCTGCGICESIASSGRVRMELDANGFLRPKVVGKLDEQDQAIIKDVCPGLIVKLDSVSRNFHPIWGYLVKARVGFATDDEVRYLGSSGGTISAILIYLLKHNYVDYVVHVGASDKQPLENKVKISRTRDEILLNTGSRYSPSATLTGIVQLLDQPGTFALVGKPCDVSALRRYAKWDKRVNEKVKFMISFMCAGIPSVIGTKNVLKQLNVREKDVRLLRYRGEGWPGTMKVKLSDGRTYQMSYEEAWGRILSKHIQFRCKICADGIGLFADIVCADAWLSREDGYPDFSERDGRNIIITRTERGEELVRKCINDGVILIEKEDLTYESIERMQPFQALRRKLVLSRILAMKVLFMHTPSYSMQMLWKAAISAGIALNIKSFLGMIRRGILKKLDMHSRS